MLILARYGNKLPGMEPQLMDIKQCIFNSFPTEWQQQFFREKIQMHQGGQPVKETPLPDIIAFMWNEEKYADAQEAARKLQETTKDKGVKITKQWEERGDGEKDSETCKYGKDPTLSFSHLNSLCTKMHEQNFNQSSL
jgi:hypothetical protein